jgi:nucleoside-diphosphate-sugar epimerase
MSSPLSILVTGSTGFVGRGLVPCLSAAGLAVRPLDPAVDLTTAADLGSAVAGAGAVVHLAARAHVLREEVSDPLAAFRAVNRDGTVRLAEAAAAAGVRRFIFISSIGVLGESTSGTPFSAASPPAPVAPYAVSKWEAEQELTRIARATGMELVIIRPPLVHGPGAPGNFARLLRLVARGLPLPFAGITGRRTFVSRTNLASLILAALKHPAVPSRPLLAGDAESLTLPELLQILGEGVGRPVRLFPLPGLVAARRFPVVGGAVRKLTDSLEVEITETTATLGWRPPESAREGLLAMARAGGTGR